MLNCQHYVRVNRKNEQFYKYKQQPDDLNTWNKIVFVFDILPIG